MINLPLQSQTRDNLTEAEGRREFACAPRLLRPHPSLHASLEVSGKCVRSYTLSDGHRGAVIDIAEALKHGRFFCEVPWGRGRVRASKN